VKKVWAAGIVFLGVIVFSCGIAPASETRGTKITMAVEFVSHAACAHIARAKGWFKKEGLQVTAFDNYVTGTALAGALSKKNIDAAYLCVIPAIVAYANGGVKLKVVCGTHRYGYGLLVNPARVSDPRDLLRKDIRVACTREGSPTDAVMHKTCDRYHLNARRLSEKALRMPPPMILLALETGRIDAGFCCEQFPSMGVQAGFRELTSARDLWPGMQGSVLVVTDNLIHRSPESVRKLVRITKKATAFIHAYPGDASRITAEALTAIRGKLFPFKMTNTLRKLSITPKAVKRALFQQMACTTAIDIKSIQQEIDYISSLGYIKRFDAHDIVDLRWLHEK